MAPRPRSTPSSKAGSIDFGPFRPTKETVTRPPVPKFDPVYRMSERSHAALRAIERADHELARLAPSRGGILERIRREALVRNAFATASIEGNPLTLSEVDSLLQPRGSPGATRGTDELEILNYAEFMASLAAQKAPRTPADVLRVHRALFRGVFKDAGKWKTRPNFIGRHADKTVVYVPTPPERVETELTNALAWLHDAKEHHPLLRVLLLHHEFESIHPFRDGNGRTGRALTPMALHEFGYEGCRYAQIDFRIHRTRDEYYANLALVERNGFTDHTPWLDYMLDIVLGAYSLAIQTARFERALPDELSERQRRVAEWFASLHHDAPQRRVKFHDVHQAFPEIAARTLKRDLALLRDAEVVDAEGELKGTTYRLRGAG